MMKQFTMDDLSYNGAHQGYIAGTTLKATTLIIGTLSGCILRKTRWGYIPKNN